MISLSLSLSLSLSFSLVHSISDGLTKRLSEWDLSQSSDDEFDLNIEGEDQTLQHVPIEDWGCTLSDSEN